MPQYTWYRRPAQDLQQLILAQENTVRFDGTLLSLNTFVVFKETLFFWFCNSEPHALPRRWSWRSWLRM